jgi:hypothetical protein|eukprot:COSAG01_NODE_9185_length_2527_cov_97.572076_2_plen_77_part_00
MKKDRSLRMQRPGWLLVLCYGKLSTQRATPGTTVATSLTLRGGSESRHGTALLFRTHNPKPVLQLADTPLRGRADS